MSSASAFKASRCGRGGVSVSCGGMTPCSSANESIRGARRCGGGRWRRRFRLERPRTVRSGLRQWQRPRHGFCRSRDTRNCGLARCRYRAHDVGFDNDVRRPADHHQMFDIIAPDQEQSSPRVDAGIFDYGQPRLAPAHGATQSSAAESAHCPRGSPDQTKHYQECQKEAYGEWHFRAEQIKHPPNSPCRRHGN